MNFRMLVTAVAAASLMTTPVLAEAASADLSRSAAPVAQENNFGDVISWVVLGVFVAALATMFIIGEDNNNPVSPG
jgi:hypothetical protein